MNEMRKCGMNGRHEMKGGCKGHGKGTHRGHAMENEEYAYGGRSSLNLTRPLSGSRKSSRRKISGFSVR